MEERLDLTELIKTKDSSDACQRHKKKGVEAKSRLVYATQQGHTNHNRHKRHMVLLWLLVISGSLCGINLAHPSKGIAYVF